MIAADPIEWVSVAGTTFGPIAAIIVTHVLTRRRLIKQDVAIGEVHNLTNDRLSTIDAKLEAALIDNVRLKDEAGEPPGPPVV